jgi:hypothetical protein
LAAPTLAIFGVVVVFATAVGLSNDLRIIYATGAVFLFAAGVWLGRNQQDYLPHFFLLFHWQRCSVTKFCGSPRSMAKRCSFAGVGVVGLFFFRICRHRVAFSTVLVVLLLIASTWFCNWYAPGQLARSFSKIKNVASPAFALQPISDDSVPIISSGESFGL